MLLLVATLVALAFANSPWREGWAHFWHQRVALELGGLELALSLGHWVNDALMAIFFFVVGLEIKRELTIGELASRERAMLPVFGALGGMVAPALVYLLLQPGGDAAAGWGIPMATDIAFAVAALALLGPRVSPGLKVFLLALAIVDDLGAVTVIALFYTDAIRLAGARRGGARARPRLRHPPRRRARVCAATSWWAPGSGWRRSAPASTPRSRACCSGCSRPCMRSASGRR